MADPTAPGVPLGSVTVEHHRTPRAEVTAEVLSGGHVLHLAVACCLFNDILALAAERGVEVTDLTVSADGGFRPAPPDPPVVSYDIQVAGRAPQDVLRRLVADAEADASVPGLLRRGAEVVPGEVTVRSA
ncbi:OsmC family protein [Georgenia sp. TF02-10]|uniref:OsmC family protein n=1 Tax=Georgenia sp. TF02-10 TaxID=2917725 RepID=UPI001FA782FC|nr:OsmC family protein [Georgenia sp. TF02-10]UNX56178.1 OsmC family protein [Georgenia sp. TF02-10]